MTPRDDDDIARDAWLREALRHAPDAAVGPPPDLSEAILREAQAKARSAAAPTPPPRRRVPWRTRLAIWLAQPSVGAGLATVMIGTVVGTMWWDRPLPQATRDTVTVAPPVPSAATADTATATTSDTAAAPARPSRPPAAGLRRSESAPAEDLARLRAESSAAAGAAAQAPPTPAIVANDALTQAARSAEAMAPAAPAVAHVAPIPPRELGVAGAERRAAGPLAKSAASPPAMADRFAAAPQAEATERAWSALRLAAAAEPQRWTWRRGDAPAQPIGDAVGAWLAELDAVARWRPAAPGGTGGAPALQLLRDGQPAHTLRIEPERLLWEPAGEAAREAPLAATQSRALRESLSRLP